MQKYRSLDKTRLIETLTRLDTRIRERFPERGISGVCSELLALAPDVCATAETLGKPIREAALRKEQQRRRRQDEIDRIAVEGKFGQGKRCFSLARIMTKLARTSEVAITITFMVMNLEKILSAIVFLLRVWPWLPRCRQSSSPRETTRTPNIVAAAA